MQGLIEDPALMAVWTEIYEKHLEKIWTSDDWRQMFDKLFPEYVATTDVPCCDFAVELARAYPEAKVILLYRDPENWLTSYQQLMALLRVSKLELFTSLFQNSIYARYQFRKSRIAWWRDVYNYPEAGKEIMPFYLNKIKKAIEPERILEFNVQDGWGPLCKFLNKEIPQDSFPHLNDAQVLVERVNQKKKQTLAPWIRVFKQITIVAGMLIIIASVYWRRSYFLDWI
ncbi:unnamed protein product [Rotaria sp. Silwood1]|nr:unnamed protein product [Rotaria sp. Silwood1]